MNAGAHDPGRVAVADDRAIHLGQLAQRGGGEVDVEGEAAGADRLDDLVVAEHDERTGASAQHALETFAQGRARRYGRESRPQPRIRVSGLSPAAQV